MLLIVRIVSILVVFVLLILVPTASGIRYEPNWASLDSRPLPQWWVDSKVGLKMHWGVYAVPGYGRETGRDDSSTWFWWYWQGERAREYTDFMAKNYPPGWMYADFAAQFKAEFFDPNYFADLIKASGARYYIFTTKHHEGFSMYDTKYSFNWNSVDVGPKMDIVGALEKAVRGRTDVHFGLYHSLYEWFNPLYMEDKANNFTTQRFVREKTGPELYEHIEKYLPDIVYSDGDWEAPDTYWNSTHFLAWLYNDSPVKDKVIVNDRWGAGIKCHHGGYFMCGDRYNPGTLQKHKFENTISIDKHAWGYRRNAKLEDFMTMEEFLETLAMTISCNGNLLMNVAPAPDGTISPIYEERLRQIGSWLRVNGEGVYDTEPWKYQNDTISFKVWYVSKKNSYGHIDVYAHVLSWPKDNILVLGAATPSGEYSGTLGSTRVTMLGLGTHALEWKKLGMQGMVVMFPILSVRKMPCQWGWVLKLENLN